MSTYSIGYTPTDATKLSDLQSVLNSLPDNTSKLIKPVDVRNSVYTLWENSIFKPTSVSGFEYIGIDQSTLRRKILFGKKSVGGQYIMSSDLISPGFIDNTADIYFYNTKPDSTDNSTTVAFLAGTGSFFKNGKLNVPYLKSQDVIGGYIDFDIVNPSGNTQSQGNINILSSNGVITLNSLQLPSINDYINGSSWNDYVLTYYWNGSNPIAEWKQSASQSIATSLYSSGTVSITGSPVIINGSDFNITDTTPTPVQIGGIPAGTTFSAASVVDIVHQMLYPYIKPVLSSNMSNYYIESGISNTLYPNFNYSVVKNATYSVTSATFNTSSGVNIVSPVFTPIVNNGTTLGSVSISSLLSLGGTQSYSTQSISMTVFDSVNSVGSTSIFKVIIPWYYGTSTSLITNNTINSIFGTSSNLVSGYLRPIVQGADPVLSISSIYNKSLTLSGQNSYIYFAYPADFPDLYSILDPNNFNQIGSFIKYIISGVNSPSGGNGSWSNKSYKVYISNLTTIGTYPLYQGTFQFKFA